MKKSLLIIVLCICFGCKNTSEAQSETTTYYFVRHAEKDNYPANNPKLLAIGNKRAQNYASFFKNIKLDAVYSTNFTRTKNTAKPTAQSQNLKTTLYGPKSLNVSKFTNKTKGQTVLVVGHSNTIPPLVNNIIGESVYEDIDESIYNRMYIITIKNGKTTHKIITID